VQSAVFPSARQVLGVRGWPKSQVLQYLPNHFGIFDAGNDLHRSAAALALLKLSLPPLDQNLAGCSVERRQA
jgi:hypothetical protein